MMYAIRLETPVRLPFAHAWDSPEQLLNRIIDFIV